MLGKGFTEIEGLFWVGKRIFEERDYAVLIGLYGNGQVIYTGEEAGISLWEEALKEHDDWVVIATKELANNLHGLDDRKIVDNDVFLTISLRADFIDCSKWVEQAIYRSHATVVQGKKELEALQNTEYGLWFAEKCRELEKAYSVYGNQGLELDCPIVVFGGGYIRQNGQWIARDSRYDYDVRSQNYMDADSIVENNFGVLLTRARKEMIILILRDSMLDETYQYFIDMGMDEL